MCWKMEGLRVLCVLVTIVNLAFGNVPVLLWESSKSDVESSFPALERVSNGEFQNFIQTKFHGMNPKPLVVICKEKSLSIEDFSWQDSMGQGNFPQLKYITQNAASVKFIPSVRDPIQAIEALTKFGYSVQSVDSDNYLDLTDGCGKIMIVNMDEAKSDEDRSHFLRGHDSKMAEIYSQLVSKCSHVIVILTGLQSSWVVREEVSRMRREVDSGNSTSDSTPELPAAFSTPEGKIIYKENQGLALLFSDTHPKLIVDKVETTLGEKSIPTVSADNSKVGLIKLSVRYNDASNKITLNFDNKTFGYWYLRSISLENSTDPSSPLVLKPSLDINAPLGMSYHCGTRVKFTNGTTTLAFSNLQLQPFFLNKGSSSFGEAVDAVEFFTPAIWSGLFVTFLLLIIFTWGVSMIMDIRTMDQFDDPKGKTITVSNTD